MYFNDASSASDLVKYCVALRCIALHCVALHCMLLHRLTFMQLYNEEIEISLAIHAAYFEELHEAV